MKESAHILIVDDLLSMRVVIKNAFKSLGFSQFDEASDGEKAWALIRTKALGGSPHDLVVSDWDMPKLNGLQLLAKVKTDDWCKKIPFLFISSDIDSSEKAKALQLGAINYMVRPFKNEDLLSVIDQIREDKGKVG